MSIITRLNKIEKRIVDLYNKLKKAESSSGGGGDFIPLTGTTEGNPVTGDIEINGDVFIHALGTSGLYISSNDDLVSLKKGGNQIIVGDEILIDLPSTSTGLHGGQDFTPNITDLDYVQKKYVDQKVADSRPYKVYTALLTQSGTNAPVATVLENTLGEEPVWTRVSLGSYKLTSPNGIFDIDKTITMITPQVSDYKLSVDTINYYPDEVRVRQNNRITLLGVDGLDHNTFEIRVYN